MKRYRLTQKAVLDMRAIGHYTTERWGKQQRSKYLRRLNARFLWLAENPGLGRHRFDINPTYLCFPEGEHLIFYRNKDNVVEIIGIPHRMMDISAHFDVSH